MHQLVEESANAGFDQAPTELVLRFHSKPQSSLDNRLYDLPQTRQILAVITELNEQAVRGVFAYHQRTNFREFFDYIEGVCGPLIYPILFPHGLLEWHPDLKGTNGKKITLMHFYSYHHAIRSPRTNFDPIHSSKMLYQMYTVDAWTKILRERMDYIKNNQVIGFCLHCVFLTSFSQ